MAEFRFVLDSIRASKVTYDRKNSAITEYDFRSYDFDALLEGYTWLHLSGIIPALGANCREMILRCLKTARGKGILTIRGDANITDDATAIRNLMNMNYDIKR